MAVRKENGNKAILITWSFLLFLGAAVTVAADAWQVHYAFKTRERRPETYLEAAEKAMNGGDYHGAILNWQEAYRRAPELHRVYKVLGDIHYNQKQWEKAIAAYQKAIDLHSPAPGVRSNLLWAFVELDRHEEAMEFAEKSIAEGFTGPEIYRRAAEAAFRAEKYTEAIPLYQQTLKMFPKDLYLMEHLRQAYLHVGDDNNAKQTESRIVQVQESLTPVQTR